MSNDPRVARAREAHRTDPNGFVQDGLELVGLIQRERAMAAHPAGKGRPREEAKEERRLAELLAQPTFEENASEVFVELLDLLVSKQADYGPHAISRSPGGALNGINVRMHDKLSRVVNLLNNANDVGTTEPIHESLRDTYRDLANYAVIACMVLDGTWPE